MRNLNFWSKFFILNFWSSQCWRLLRPCTKWRGQKKMKSISFHQYSWNSEVETTWIGLIGWHHKTSNRYLLYISKLNGMIFSFSGKWQLVACQHDSAFPKALICFHFWKKRRNRERNLVINHPVQDGKILFSISADVDVVSAQFR